MFLRLCHAACSATCSAEVRMVVKPAEAEPRQARWLSVGFRVGHNFGDAAFDLVLHALQAI